MAEKQTIPSRQTLLLPDVFDRVIARVRAGERPAPLAKLIADAEATLAIEPPSVIDKPHVPPTGDKRDYFSLSIYFWPDPSKPDGLPYVPRDGQVNPETKDYDLWRFDLMAKSVDTLALAYALTGDERYAEKAVAFLRRWFLDERTGMRPNMLFAQYIPGDHVITPWPEYPARFVPGTNGRNGVYVSFGGVIEDLALIPLTDSVRLLRGSPHWADADDAGMRKWYADYTHWLRTHQHGLDEAACRNNHASWYWADIACFLEFTGQPEEAARIIAEQLPERLRQQIEPDGSQPEELVRAISKSYTAFTLASFANIAIVATRCGYDAWTARTTDGRAIKQAFDWFRPYLTDEQPWTWKQIKPFDPGVVIGAIVACAEQFPAEGYDVAARKVRGLADDHRFRLIYDLI